MDDVDFKTAETGLTIANTDIKLIVNGGASADKNSGGGTHRANGVYGVTFDATDTATVGEMEVSVKVAGALPVFKTFFVLEEAVYDALFAASALGYLQPTVAGRTLDVSAGGEAGIDWANIGSPTTAQNLSATNIDVDQVVASVSGAVGSVTGAVGSVTGAVGSVTAAVTVGTNNDKTGYSLAADQAVNVTKISGSATAADNLEAGALGLVSSTCAAGSTTTSIVTNLTEATDDHYNGRVITFTSGALLGQSSSISDYVGATKTLTVVALTEAPANTDAFVIS